jgi:NAD(P)-dependent dehydrogenase (short-subunit alcohol dehydrogenase family)
MTDLTGKVAVVTGASRGLGQRAAMRLAAQGAAVALIARGAAPLHETARLIGQRGGRAVAFTADVRDPQSIEATKAAIAGQLGKPAILVNAAGAFGPIQRIRDSDVAQWIETVQVNTVAPYLTCRAFVGAMIDGRWGRIVNVSSAATLHPPGPMNSAYGTSKVALNQFTRHLAAELAGTGVTANVIHPGDVKTAMWAYIRDTAELLGADGADYRQWAEWVAATGGDDPEKAADLILDLMGDAAAGVNGRFLWIRDGLQPARESWGEPDAGQPWRDEA